MLDVLREYFKPELLNPIDEIITFNPLSSSIIYQIVDKFIAQLNARLTEQRIHVVLTDAAHEYVASAGFDSVYGARPLKRFIQRTIETKLARALIAGQIEMDTTVVVDVQDGEIVLKFEK